METMIARIGTPLYCACGSTMVQIRRADLGGLATAECRNPKCELAGKLFAGPTVQLQEIKVAAPEGNGSI